MQFKLVADEVRLHLRTSLGRLGHVMSNNRLWEEQIRLTRCKLGYLRCKLG